jgi:orotate phosphoribosyltransferase
VLDDVITTGKSALSVVNALRAGKNGKKAEVLSVYSVFDWDIPSVNKMFEENNIEKYSLVTVKTLLDYGVENQLLDKKVADKLLEFYNTLN